jgi:hypothetical protein
MNINKQTIQKLFRENLTGEEKPWKILHDEIVETKNAIKKRLLSINGVQLKQVSYGSSRRDAENENDICTFSVKDDHYRSGYDFRLKLDEYNHLVIKYSYSGSAHVASIDELIAFIKVLQIRIDRKVTQKNKRKKVREFKAQAIVAQVKKLAKEDKFDFYTQTDTVKLTLFIRLSDKECMEIDIPFNRFQEILPELREIIAAVRSVHVKGVKFKLNSKSGWYSSRWIRHDSL